MNEVVTIGADGFTLNLRLPELGMPEILSFASFATSDDALFDVERSSRVNGMDVAVPSSVLLPTGGMGLLGWLEI